MRNSTISSLLRFHVQIDTDSSFEALSKRLESALGCTFQPSDSNSFDWWEKAVEARLLGMEITLSYDWETDKQPNRIYYLVGDIAEEVNAYWELVQTYINISNYILKLLHITDSTDWYLPGQ